MKLQKMCIVIVCLSLLINSVTIAKENLQVLPDTIDGFKPYAQVIKKQFGCSCDPPPLNVPPS